MKRTETIIIGGGQAGLAMSYCLTERGIEHVILERGRLAERWRSERWDSLRLLTPNWQSRLPGYRYSGSDPDGYMSCGELVDYLSAYAASFGAPLEQDTTVLAVQRSAPDHYFVTTTNGVWTAPTVVIATGECDTPHRPPFATAVSPAIDSTVPTEYRSPSELADGGVLVVGASASGVQLADEIHRSGRPVVLSVSSHTRLPRRYRGRNIMGWLDAMGVLDETPDQVKSVEASRRAPSLQLVGDPHRSVDLASLQRLGVRLAGRAVAASGDQVWFADDLQKTVRSADDKLRRTLARVDEFIERAGLASRVDAPDPVLPVAIEPILRRLDLRRAGIRTIVWATGFVQRYPWLEVPVLDERGALRHEGGITPARGLYALGLRFLRRRKSTFIDGVGDDARWIADHIETTLTCPSSRAA